MIQAKEECKLLEVLKFPVVIGYEGSFESFEENCLCIVMEYAMGGKLKIIFIKIIFCNSFFYFILKDLLIKLLKNIKRMENKFLEIK